MSTFSVKVRPVTILEHPNADLLQLAQVDDYRAVVGKGQYQTGNLVVYIPEQSIVPDNLLEEMGLVGKLAGSEHNRVKAVKLRGELSQGLCYSPAVWPEQWAEGYDVAGELSITKWEPPVPIEMAGQVEANPGGIFRTYTDIENLQAYPDTFTEGETVWVTEKLHGTCCIVGIVNGQRVVSSKGIAGRGLVLKEAEGNVYWRAVEQAGLFEKLERLMEDWGATNVVLFGEVIGVQDLMYGLQKGQITFRAFDIYLDMDESTGFLPYENFPDIAVDYDIDIVPILYHGPFNREKVMAFRDGQSTIANNIREGVVIRPEQEREDSRFGRVVLKWISPDYLTRKGGTEMN